MDIHVINLISGTHRLPNDWLRRRSLPMVTGIRYLVRDFSDSGWKIVDSRTRNPSGDLGTDCIYKRRLPGLGTKLFREIFAVEEFQSNGFCHST